MKTFRCTCGNRLFFDNSQCVQCGKETGFCPRYREVTALVPDGSGRLICGHEGCGATLQRCQNHQHGVCNWCVEVPEEDNAVPQLLCDSCSLTKVIPDLSVAGNQHNWALLEAAKRRVLYTLYLLKFPIGTPGNEVEPKLSFEFKASTTEPVFTGHDDGLITINLDEADDVKREQARVNFGEPHRTLVGHFRHELGHYYWDVLVKDRCEEEFRRLFGDEREPSYEQAKDAYYQNGPAADWPGRCISQYASMHPWEDFAETFGAYLDMISILDTASHLGGRELPDADAKKMLQGYQQVGMLVNELNREMGLKDLVPEIFSEPVAEKIAFIHNLVKKPLTWKKRSSSEPTAA